MGGKKANCMLYSGVECSAVTVAAVGCADTVLHWTVLRYTTVLHVGLYICLGSMKDVTRWQTRAMLQVVMAPAM